MAILTVSRQFGAGGRTLGKEVAQKLGYTLIDEGMVGRIADRAKVSKNWVRSIEKEAGGSLLKFISYLVPKRYVSQILDDTRGYLDEEVYVSTLTEVINELAKEDNCVIVGRGGQYILRDHPGVYHVLLVAEMDHRLNFMVENYNLRQEEAKTVIRVREKRRVNLYRKFGREDYNDPHLYHLVLNMSKLSMAKAVEVTAGLVG
jgi:cytidylate kinase